MALTVEQGFADEPAGETKHPKMLLVRYIRGRVDAVETAPFPRPVHALEQAKGHVENGRRRKLVKLS